jgi:hypothetical protein
MDFSASCAAARSIAARPISAAACLSPHEDFPAGCATKQPMLPRSHMTRRDTLDRLDLCRLGPE